MTPVRIFSLRSEISGYNVVVAQLFGPRRLVVKEEAGLNFSESGGCAKAVVPDGAISDPLQIYEACCLTRNARLLYHTNMSALMLEPTAIWIIRH